MRGGVGDYTVRLTAALIERGHDIFLLSREGTTSPQPDVPLKTVPRWTPGLFSAVRRWQNENALDVISFQYQTAAYDMSPFVHFLPHFASNFVTTFHDLRVPYLFPKAGSIRHWLVKHLARYSDAAIVTNEEDKAEIQSFRDADFIPIGSNITVNAASPIELARFQQQHQITADDFVVVFFGFLHPTKGIRHLIEAAKIVRDAGIPLRLVIAGGRSHPSDPLVAEYADEIDQLLAGTALEDRVIWTGFIDEEEASLWLQVADSVVLPFNIGASLRNGSIIAAIMHGCAIITTEPKAPSIVYENGKHMMLVERENAAALASAMQKLYSDQGLRQRLHAGVAELRHLFTWKSVAERYEQTFERITGAK